MSLPLVTDLCLINQFQKRLMNEGRRLERVPGRLLLHVVGCELFQFVVDDRQKLFRGCAVPFRNLLNKLSRFRNRGGHCACRKNSGEQIQHQSGISQHRCLD